MSTYLCPLERWPLLAAERAETASGQFEESEKLVQAAVLVAEWTEQAVVKWKQLQKKQKAIEAGDVMDWRALELEGPGWMVCPEAEFLALASSKSQEAEIPATSEEWIRHRRPQPQIDVAEEVVEQGSGKAAVE